MSSSIGDVHWRVPVGCGFSGFFTEVVLGYLPALHTLGVKASLLSGRCDDTWISQHLEPGDATVLRDSWIDEHALTPAQTAASIAIEHGEPCGMRRWPMGSPSRPRRVIARAMSEGDLSPSNAQCLTNADEVWVPTQWHVERFVAAGVRNEALRILPEAVDTTFFSPDHPAAVQARRSNSRFRNAPFSFVSVFKWEQRKGWDLLLRAYWLEFGAAEREKVVLRLKTYLPSWEPGPRDLNMHLAQFARYELEQRRDELPAVELLVEDVSRDDMRAIYATADAFVLPTRGEGWGLPICEAMAMGVPPIATNFSGPTAFLTPDNSYALPVHRALPGGFAEPSVEALRGAMRHAYDERGELGARRGAVARADMVRHFSREAVGKVLLQRLQESAAVQPSIVEEQSVGGASHGKRSGKRRRRTASASGAAADAGDSARREQVKDEVRRARKEL